MQCRNKGAVSSSSALGARLGLVLQTRPRAAGGRGGTGTSLLCHCHSAQSQSSARWLHCQQMQTPSQGVLLPREKSSPGPVNFQLYIFQTIQCLVLTFECDPYTIHQTVHTQISKPICIAPANRKQSKGCPVKALLWKFYMQVSEQSVQTHKKMWPAVLAQAPSAHNN